MNKIVKMMFIMIILTTINSYSYTKRGTITQFIICSDTYEPDILAKIVVEHEATVIDTFFIQSGINIKSRGLLTSAIYYRLKKKVVTVNCNSTNYVYSIVPDSDPVE